MKSSYSRIATRRSATSINSSTTSGIPTRKSARIGRPPRLRRAAAADRRLRPAGDSIRAVSSSNGKTIEHWLNGTLVLHYELDSPALREAIAKSKFKDVERFGKLQNGHILLQDHGNRVWYAASNPPPRRRYADAEHAEARRRVTRRPGRGQRERAAGRCHDRRDTFHLVRLAEHVEEAGALPACEPPRVRPLRADFRSSPAAANASITRITLACGSTMATSTASTSGTTPTRFQPIAPRRWGQSAQADCRSQGRLGSR